MADDRSAALYRMVLPDHVRPFGARAERRLEKAGSAVDDLVLRSRAEVDAFQAAQGVATTPQLFIAGQRVGGGDKLETFLDQAQAG